MPEYVVRNDSEQPFALTRTRGDSMVPRHTVFSRQKWVFFFYLLWLIVLSQIMPFNILLFQVLSIAADVPSGTSARCHTMYADT